MMYILVNNVLWLIPWLPDLISILHVPSCWLLLHLHSLKQHNQHQGRQLSGFSSHHCQGHTVRICVGYIFSYYYSLNWNMSMQVYMITWYSEFCLIHLSSALVKLHLYSSVGEGLRGFSFWKKNIIMYTTNLWLKKSSHRSTYRI